LDKGEKKARRRVISKRPDFVFCFAGEMTGSGFPFVS
jgi:hypothetical protein